MDNLGIEKQELDEDDQNYIEPHEADEENKPLSSDTPANNPDYINELERIGQLRDEALITDEEFEMKKNSYLVCRHLHK